MQHQITRHTIPIFQIAQIIKGFEKQGGDVAKILNQVGISPVLLDSPLSRVTQAQFAALILALRRRMRDETWGLSSHPVKIGTFSLACELMVRCKDLGEALREGVRLYHQVLGDLTPRLVISGGIASCRLISKVPQDTQTAYLRRHYLYFAYALCCWLLARRFPIESVILPSSMQTQQTDVQFLFQSKIEFVDQNYVAFNFDEKWLSLPVVQTPNNLEGFLKQTPGNLLVKYRDQTSYSERTRRILRRQLSTQMPSLEEVSELLSVTPQTLRRRLQDEGVGYQMIKDELRRDIAIEYLSKSELSILEIAAQLGFAEASAFNRAFKDWTGFSPGAYRQTKFNESDSI